MNNLCLAPVKIAVMSMDKPSVIVKRTKIQEVFDYCLDNKLEFSVKERLVGIDEYEIIVDISDIRKAILFGMFLRENRFELSGMPQQDAKVAPRKPAAARKPAETPAATMPVAPAPVVIPTPEIPREEETSEESREESNLPLSFDLN